MNECLTLRPQIAANLDNSQRLNWNKTRDNSWLFQILPKALKHYSIFHTVTFYMTCESSQSDCSDSLDRDCYDIIDCPDGICETW